MTISELFLSSLQEGYDAAGKIIEKKDKAMAYAAIAQAIASSGLVSSTKVIPTSEVEEAKEDKKETKKNSKKDSLKPEAGKVKEETKEVKEEEQEEIPPVEETQPESEVEVSDEWTDEMIKLKAEKSERLKAYVESWGEDYVYNQCVPAFFENPKTVGADHIRPTNIDGFVSYLDQIAASIAEE